MLKVLVMGGALLLTVQAQEGIPGVGTRMRVSSKVAQGHLKKKVDLKLPQEAKGQQLAGKIVVAIVVDLEGNVTDAKLESGKPELADAALKAVKQWKYEPFLLNGKPIVTETTVIFLFVPRS